MAASAKTGDPMAQLVRSVDLLVRLKVQEIRGDRNQTDMIKVLGTMGLSGSDIASLLGISTTTVAPILSRIRAGAKGSKSGRGGGSRKKK